MCDIKQIVEDNALIVENALKAFFLKRKDTTLYKAMKYSTMCGGKRIRPFLVI